VRSIHELTEIIRTARFLPVVTIRDWQDAVPLGRALLDGGLPLAQVTFRTEVAQRAILRLRAELPQLLVAGGSVLDVVTVEKAIDAGAALIVTPGFNPAVVDYCCERGIPIIPGANAPTEVELARSRGLPLVGFFPAEASGGIPLLRALAGPYVGMRYMPSGGITLQNLPAYLAVPEVAACAGTWLATADAIAARRFDEIEANARATVSLVQSMAGDSAKAAATGGA
jgi:2-dehydro-3-deoxyphosphogluconate aldolase/(4S)-4-hydroxy-2-oxoglutarate aldolase